MKERLLALRPYALRFVGYPLFFGFWFLVFVYVTFPYDRLKEVIIAQVEAPRATASGGLRQGMQLSIGELGPTFLPGLHARNVVLTTLPPREGERPVITRMDDVVVHVGLFSLLRSMINANVSIEGMGGKTDAHLEYANGGTTPGLRALDLKFDGVRVGEIAPVTQMVGLPLFGTLNGTVELRVPDGKTQQAQGAIHLTVDGLKIGDGHAQYQIPHFGGVTIEQIVAGRLQADVTIRDGVATIDTLHAQSPEFQLTMDGRVEFRPLLPESALNVGVRFALTDVYRHKSETANRIMMVMDTVPDLQAARRPDHTLGFRCRGTFERGVTCPPDRAGPAGRAGAVPPRRGF